jgi:hypothetical protein
MSRSVPTQLFRITPGPVVHATDGIMDANHLCKEIAYLTDYAGKMAACVGARSFEVGLVEDEASQTAFYRLPLGRSLNEALVNGVVNTARKKSLSAVLKELWEE